MSKTIRVIVTEPGGANRAPRTLSVSGDETLLTLNALLIPEYSTSDHTIKWIYLGHTLSESLPTNIESGSTMHVVVRQVTQPPTESADPSVHSPGGPVPDVDKHLLHFIHIVFAVFLSFLWNQYINDRSLFSGISLSVLLGLSAVLVLSIVHQVYPS